MCDKALNDLSMCGHAEIDPVLCAYWMYLVPMVLARQSWHCCTICSIVLEQLSHMAGAQKQLLVHRSELPYPLWQPLQQRADERLLLHCCIITSM